MPVLVDLFLTFARVGVMMFGGGYAMLPILQREVVEKKGWATEEQLAGNLAAVEEVYAAATASGEPSGDAPAGDIVVNDDGTFIMQKTGTNMDGAEFAMTVTGILNDDGSVTLTGIFDGDLNVMELATEEQIAADTASVLEALGR